MSRIAHDKHNLEQTRQLLDLLFDPDELVELRCIESWEEDGQKQSRLHRRFWLTPQQIIERAGELAELNHVPSSANIYFGVCPRPTEDSSKSADIRAVGALWADVDNCPPEAALKRADKAGLPEPSITISSGHGTHLYWLLEEPFTVDSPDDRRRIESIVEAVGDAVDGDDVHDLARLLRLPGFMNVKNIRGGAAPLLCEVFDIKGVRRYPLDVFPTPAPQRVAAGNAGPGGRRHGDGPLPRALARLETARAGERSEADFAACCELIRAGFAADGAWGVVQDKSKFAERGREYFDGTWANALAEVQEDKAERGHRSLVPSTVEVLGVDEEMRTLIWSKGAGRVWPIAKLRDLDIATIIQLAGRDAVQPVLSSFGASAPGVLRNAIAEASRRRIFAAEDFLGQGVWRVPGVEGVLVVVGSRAILVKRAAPGIAVQEVDEPVVGGKIVDFTGNRGWADPEVLIEAIKAIGEQGGTRQLWERLVGALDCWDFARPRDRELVAGLVLATPLQATLPFRPHVWITGATNTGKTALLTLLNHLWPHATHVEGETSEAGIRQEVHHSSLPLLIDEFEASRGRPRVVKLLRSGTRGGRIVKGTPGGRPIRFTMRHIAWLASIDVDLRRAGDMNRFIKVELLPSDRIVIAEPAELRDFGTALIAAGVVLADCICDWWQRLSKSEAHRAQGRLSEAYALPVAVQAAFLGLDRAGAESVLSAVISDQEAILAAQFEPDHTALLQAILAARIRTELQIGEMGLSRPSPSDYAVSRVIQEVRRRPGCKCEYDLATNGIKLVGGDRIFFSPKVLQQRLLRGTPWQEVNVADILDRAPGACRTRLRIEGRPDRGVIIPLELLHLGEGDDGEEIPDGSSHDD